METEHLPSVHVLNQLGLLTPMCCPVPSLILLPHFCLSPCGYHSSVVQVGEPEAEGSDAPSIIPSCFLAGNQPTRESWKQTGGGGCGGVCGLCVCVCCLCLCVCANLVRLRAYPSLCAAAYSCVRWKLCQLYYFTEIPEEEVKSQMCESGKAHFWLGCLFVFYACALSESKDTAGFLLQGRHSL